MSTISFAPTRDLTRSAANCDRLWRAYLAEAKYESIRMLRAPSFGAPLIALPIIFYLFFGVLIAGGSKDPKIITGLFSGFAVMGVMGPAMFGFGAVLSVERDQGLLRLKRALPMPPAANLLARMLMALLFGAIVTSLMVACGLTLGHVPLNAAQSLCFAAVTIVGSVPFCAIGLFLGTLMKGQVAPAVANLTYLAMAYLGGLWFPLPPGARWILQLSPAFHLDQLSLGAAGAASIGSPFVHLAVLLGVTLCFTALAVRRLARFDWRYTTVAEPKIRPIGGMHMRYVCLFALMLPLLNAQDGAAIYKERCAMCHDSPQERVPSLAAIKAMSGEAIYVALTNGTMKSRAEGLSTPQIFALLGYIGPTGGAQAPPATITPTCKGSAAFQFGSNAPQWDGWSPTLTNSRFQNAAAAKLTAADVPKLKLKWAFNLGEVTVARSQPAFAGGRVFIASATGILYSLDPASGCTYWGFATKSGIRSGVAIGDAGRTPAVFFGDAGANIYALNAQTGAVLWKVHPVDHFATMTTATPRYYKGVIYEPFSSFEEALGPDPKVQCCTFRGSVVALDAATGKKIWQTFTIAETPEPTRKNAAGTQQFGPSGAGVWSSPTIDEQLGALYVATGDNYSDPPSNTSDAVLAMDLKTGELLWSRQLTEKDAFNTACTVPPFVNCPEAKGPDFDFGQSPMLVQLHGRQRALVIGQKSGMVHAIDPDRKGQILWQTRAGQGSPLGGSQWGSAADAQKAYVAISDVVLAPVIDPKLPQGFRLNLDPKKGGGLHALDLNTGKIVWSAKTIPCADTRTDCSPAQSAAVTAIPGVIFSGALDGHLRAYSASTGEILWDTDTEREFETVNGKPAHGGSMDGAGPTVVNGMVFVNSGYNQFGGMPGNVFLAFSVDGK